MIWGRGLLCAGEQYVQGEICQIFTLATPRHNVHKIKKNDFRQKFSRFTTKENFECTLPNWTRPGTQTSSHRLAVTHVYCLCHQILFGFLVFTLRYCRLYWSVKSGRCRWLTASCSDLMYLYRTLANSDKQFAVQIKLIFIQLLVNTHTKLSLLANYLSLSLHVALWIQKRRHLSQFSVDASECA